MGYPANLTDAQWNFIKPIFEQSRGKYGNRSKWDKRVLVNAVLYINKTGCQWNMLPKDFPPYTIVSSFFHRAKAKGIWTQMNMQLVELSRISSGRSSQPSYALIDSQSAKTTGNADDRGYDGGKKQRDVKDI